MFVVQVLFKVNFAKIGLSSAILRPYHCFQHGRCLPFDGIEGEERRQVNLMSLFTFPPLRAHLVPRAPAFLGPLGQRPSLKAVCHSCRPTTTRPRLMVACHSVTDDSQQGRTDTPDTGITARGNAPVPLCPMRQKAHGYLPSGKKRREGTPTSPAVGRHVQVLISVFFTTRVCHAFLAQPPVQPRRLVEP